MHRRFVVILTALLALSCSSSRNAPPTVTERPDFGRHFDAAGVKGTFILFDAQNNTFLVSDRERAEKRFIPASTFKILNSLIALDTGAVMDENETIPWDGVDRGNPEWNRDLNMREAIRVSAVWFYQEMARRVGPTRMQEGVSSAAYGNRNVGGGIDRFWLDGALQITPREQVEFLVRLDRGQLLFSSRAIRTLRDILKVEQNGETTLYAKTGWAMAGKPQTGWYVGWVEQGKKGRWYFATNLDIEKAGDARARVDITRAILKELQILP